MPCSSDLEPVNYFFVLIKVSAAKKEIEGEKDLKKKGRFATTCPNSLLIS